MAKQRSLEEIKAMKEWDRMSPTEQANFNYEQQFGEGSIANMAAGCGPNTVENNERYRGGR